MMPNPLVTQTAAQVARRVPYLRRLPILRLLILGELILLARDHYERLSPRERRRLVRLLREGNGRPSNLSERQRDELSALIAKAEPRAFVGLAAERLSPVPLPAGLSGRRSA
jgi:hypothetical protein